MDRERVEFPGPLGTPLAGPSSNVVDLVAATDYLRDHQAAFAASADPAAP
ncbi:MULTISPECIES: hypothetical protein [unclassified Nocardioides]|nr:MULTISPECIES: hypothetical protein [unclassified Nocardioides]